MFIEELTSLLWSIYFTCLVSDKDCSLLCFLPGGYSHTLPIRVCAAQRGRNFEAPDLERGIHFERAKAPVL